MVLNTNYYERLKRKRIPFAVTLELTNRCNLSCLHCYIRVQGDGFKKKELKFTEICGLLEQLSDAGVMYLTLTGGEPLLRPDFKDIYLFAKNKKFAITVLTNGTLINNDLIKFFKEYPPLMLEISSYGLTSLAYEDVTGVKGSFDSFQEGIDLLKKTNIRFLLRLVIIKKNYKEAIIMKDVIKKSGIRCAFGFSLAPRIDKEALKSLLIKKQRLGPVEMADLYNNFRKYSSNYDKCHNHHYDRLVSCGAGMYSCEISAYGKLNKCAYFDEPNIDLRKTKFIDAWHSLKIDKTPMMDKKKACGDCLFKSSCAWCPGLAYMETGYSDRKVEYLCRLMRALEKKPKNA